MLQYFEADETMWSLRFAFGNGSTNDDTKFGAEVFMLAEQTDTAKR
jgi:hypothetical protein